MSSPGPVPVPSATTMAMANATANSGYLQIQDVVKDFGGGSVAVNHVTLEIAKGEIFALLGASGCGKTTLLRMLGGFDSPTSGRIVLNGQDLAGLAPYERPINMMFQSYALFPHMNVIENVAYGLKMTGVAKPIAKARALETMKNVGLVGYDERLPSELSGGQQQRVALARALVLEPAVLLFDEPLSNLDARLRREMREEIRGLQQRLGLTVAYVTHDQSEALAVSDQIIVMDHGVIAQAGTPQELYEYPTSEFVAGFMGEAMLFPGVSGADGSVQLGPLTIAARQQVTPGEVKVAVRPEAWHIHRDGSGLPGKLLKLAYLGSFFEYTFQTTLGPIFVVSPDLTDVLVVGADVGLTLADHGVSVVAAQ